jgi:riboflavin kinase/FMN adenylyltransferase
MKVFHGLEEYQQVTRPAVTIGTFDGVHYGHQKILNRLKTVAEQQQGESLLMTFWPHPRKVLQPANNDLALLNTLNEKISLLERYGLDNLLVLPFTREFSQQSAHGFIKDLLVDAIGVHTLVIGYDHRFGQNREGGYEDLEAASHTYGYHLEQIPAQEINDSTVSSTKVREAVEAGRIQEVTRYLQHYYLLRGTVVYGDQLGRELGYPTANLEVEEDVKLIPAEGVYLVRVHCLGQTYHGMLNIGRRPAVTANGDKRVEVYIFNFEGNLYEQTVTLEFLEWLRGDQHFDGLEALKAQMDQDMANALARIPDHPASG